LTSSPANMISVATIRGASKSLYRKSSTFRNLLPYLNEEDVINLEAFKMFLSVIKIKLQDDEILKIFQYIDSTQKGTIDMVKLMRFIKIPFNPAEQIRMGMSLNIHNPAHFQKYHSLYDQGRPFAFNLVPGPNQIGTYFYDSSAPGIDQFPGRGSCLCFINNVRVERANFWEIVQTLKKIPCPFDLTFKNIQTPGVIEEIDTDGHFKLIRRELTKDWQNLLERPLLYKQAEEKEIDDLNCVSPYYDHCRHCPKEKAWYLNIHLFMEDETFSMSSAILIFFIYFLIFVSTSIYIFETVPRLEWSGWNTLEAVVSILFTIEFAVRISCCRRVSKYMKDTMNLVDFCAVFPFWIELISDGSLKPQSLRMVRIIRLLRLVRLARSRNLALTISVFSRTLRSVSQWLIMFIFFIILTITILASFQYFNEAGVITVISDCDNFKSKTSCSGTSVSESFTFNRISSANCRSSCQEIVLGGCCFFDQMTGNCVFYSASSPVQSLPSNQSSLMAGLCRVKENRIREGESDPSLYKEIPSSMWWAAATVNMVGYGEIWPISIYGRIVGAISCFVGLLCMAFPLIVVGSSFKAEIVRVKFRMNDPDSNANFGSVKWLLEDMNQIAGKQIFNLDDEFVFLDNKLDTKNKVKQILTRRSGWSVLPFAGNEILDRPRISQFKLYTLYALYGRKLRYWKDARRKYRRAFKSKVKMALRRQCKIRKKNVPPARMDLGDRAPDPWYEFEPPLVRVKESIQENPENEVYVFSESLSKVSESPKISEAKDLPNREESKVTSPTILKENLSLVKQPFVEGNRDESPSLNLVVQDRSRGSGEEYGHAL